MRNLVEKMVEERDLRGLQRLMEENGLVVDFCDVDQVLGLERCQPELSDVWFDDDPDEGEMPGWMFGSQQFREGEMVDLLVELME